MDYLLLPLNGLTQVNILVTIAVTAVFWQVNILNVITAQGSESELESQLIIQSRKLKQDLINRSSNIFKASYLSNNINFSNIIFWHSNLLIMSETDEGYFKKCVVHTKLDIYVFIFTQFILFIYHYMIWYKT
jgi:hypothetical protein